MTTSSVPKSKAKPGWPHIDALGYGGDYNPEQWPRAVWDEDMLLMKKAGVNVVSIGIFSWSVIQPTEDTWAFEWLDDLMDLLHANGIHVDLGTATASPPPWLTTKYPEILPVTDRGEVQWPGGRQQWRPTSPVFRKYALILVRRLAERYGSHPALIAWHVNNELGCHNHFDYSDDAARAFRKFLETRYSGNISKLNDAWEAAFWSQRYSTFDEILPPRLAPKGTWPNPGQTLDWKRFSSDALLDYYKDERDILHSLTPDIPVTTNFMVMGPRKRDADYSKWAKEMDFVSNDHYVLVGRDEVSFCASFCAGISRDRPWWLMEHSTSAVNWHHINVPKEQGAMSSESLTHLAHGADALCFFQWRQSKAGGERYHSSMLPHAGENSQIFRNVCELGQNLKDLAEIKGSTMRRAPIAIVFDYEAWWTSEMNSQPSMEMSYHREALDWYKTALDLGFRADIVPLDAPLEGYQMVVAPVLYSIEENDRKRIHQYVEQGGHLVTTYFSGIVNESNHMYLGGYPGAFRDLLGVRIEEFCPLPEGRTVKLSGGETGSLWTDPIEVVSKEVEVLRRYEDWRWAGQPAVTRRQVENGSAAYVSTRLGPEGLKGVLGELAGKAGVSSELSEALRGKVEHTIRVKGDNEWHFLINRSEVEVGLPTNVHELLNTGAKGRAAKLHEYGVAVYRSKRGDSLF